MAKLALRLADSNPEFRPEYEEIAQQCRYEYFSQILKHFPHLIQTQGPKG